MQKAQSFSRCDMVKYGVVPLTPPRHLKKTVLDGEIQNRFLLPRFYSAPVSTRQRPNLFGISTCRQVIEFHLRVLHLRLCGFDVRFEFYPLDNGDCFGQRTRAPSQHLHRTQVRCDKPVIPSNPVSLPASRLGYGWRRPIFAGCSPHVS